MADVKKNQSKVYNALKGMGYSGIGASEEEFAAKMSNPKNREKVYKALSSKGYKGIGKDQAAFDSLIYQAPAAQTQVAAQPQPTKQPAAQPQQASQQPEVPKQTYTPTWQEQMAFGQTINSAKNTAKGAKAGLEKTIQNLDTYREQQAVTGGVAKSAPKWNPETGEMEQSYITSAGTEHQNQYEAENIQRKLNDAYWREAHPMEAAEREIGQDLRDIRTEEERLTEQRKAAEGNKRPEDKTWWDYFKEGFGASAVTAMAPMGSNVDRDMVEAEMTRKGSYGAERQAIMKEQDVLLARRRLAEEAQQLLTDVRKDQKDYGILGGLGRAGEKVLETALNPRTWDFGEADMASQLAVANAVIKADSGLGVTSNEQKLLDTWAKNAAINSQFGDQLSGWTKAGMVTGESLPFMLEMAMNPASGLGQAATTQLVKYSLKKYGTKWVKDHAKSMLAKKIATRLIGDVVGSGIMASTTGAARVAADYEKRMTGQVDIGMDANGDIIYNGIKQETKENPGAALFKALSSTSIENWSEMAGNYLGFINNFFGKALGKTVIGKAGRKALETTGSIESVSLNKAQKFIYDLAAGKGIGAFSQGLKQFADRTQWHGVINEYLEEEIGNIANAAIVGDMTFDTAKDTGVFNLEQNIDTFCGVALMGGFMSAMNTAGFAAHKINYDVDRVSNANAQIFGDQLWNRIKTTIDSSIGDPRTMNDVLTDLVRGDGGMFDANGKKAILKYTQAALEKQGAEMAQYQPRMAASTREEVATPEGKKYVVTSLDKNGDTIDQQAFNSEDEAIAYEGELKMNQQQQDYKDYLSMTNKLSYPEASQVVSDFMEANGIEADNAEAIAAINDPKSELGKQFQKFKMERILAKAQANQEAIATFEKENGWTPGTVQWLSEQDPMQLDAEGLAMADQARTFLEGLAYPANEVHVEHEQQVGAEAAQGVVEEVISEDDMIDPLDNEGQLIVDQYNNARNAANNLFARNEDLAQEFWRLLRMGLSPQEVISSLDTFSPADVQTIIDYFNAEARQEAFMREAARQIDDVAHRNRERRTFQGTINGLPDKENVVTIMDDEGNSYALVSGNVTTDSQWKVTGSDSGLIIGVDANGDFVSLSDKHLHIAPSTQTLDQYEEEERTRLQEAVTTVVDPNQAMNPNIQQTESAGTEQSGNLDNAGGEAVVNNNNGANNPPATAPSTSSGENATKMQGTTIESVTDKDGIKRYENGIAVDDAIADMIASGDDVNEIADASIAEAQAIVDKINGKATKTRKDLVDRKKAQDTITYYNNVKARWAEVQQEKLPAESEENVNVQPEQPNVEEKPVSSQQNLTVEEQKQQRIAEAKAKYGELFDDDFTKANDVYELVSMWVGRKRNLAWDDVNGKRGLQKELGWTRKIGGDTKYIETLLAKNGEGMGVDEFAHMVWESPENDIMGEKRFSTEEIKEALLDLLKSAQSKSDVVDYALNTRIAQAEAAMQEQQKQAEEGAEDQTPFVPFTDQELAEMKDSLPFPESTDEEIPDSPITQLEKAIAELQQQEGMPPIRLVDTDRMSEEDWINLAAMYYGEEVFFSQEDIDKARNYILSEGVFYDPETGDVTVYSDSQTADDVTKKVESLIEYLNDRVQEERRDNGLETDVSQRTETEIAAGESAEAPAAETGDGSESQGNPESVEDPYLQPRNAEEEQIIANVIAQLQQEIGEAVNEQNKARSELEKAMARESERATDMFGNDNALNQPGQLFDNSDMPIDNSMEGVERRTAEEREKLQEATNKLNQLQSLEERNSRVRGALDNYRRQTTIEDIDESDPDGISNRIKESGESREVSTPDGIRYEQDYLIDGKHKVTKIDAPNAKGDYTGSSYEYNGKTYGDLNEIVRDIDIDERHKREYDEYIKPLISKTNEELQQLKKAKEDAVSGDLKQLQGDLEYSAINLVITQREIDGKNANPLIKLGEVYKSGDDSIVLNSVESGKNGEKNYTGTFFSPGEEARPYSMRENDFLFYLNNGDYKLETPESEGTDPMEAIERNAQQFRKEQEKKKPKTEPNPKSAKVEVGSDYGKNNKVVTQQEYNDLVDEWRRLHGQLNSGLVTAAQLGFVMSRMAAFHIEAGARKFADFVKKMVETFDETVIPYLKSGYLAAKYLPGMEEYAKEMDSEETVAAFDLLSYDKQNGNSVNDNKAENNDTDNSVSLPEKSVSEEQMKAYALFVEQASQKLEQALTSDKKPFGSITALRQFAKECGIDVDMEGRDDILLQELVEDAIIRAGRNIVKRNGGNLTKEVYDDIVKLYYMQPTISQRSSNRIKMQQYSTPLPMSFVADMFAGEGAESVLEPTAGNGMMVFAIPREKVHVNELDATRLAVLQPQPFMKVTNQDATLPFEGNEQYDAIIANPPFGAAPAKDYDGKMISGLDEQIALNALSKMKDDGKAAIIIGGNMEYGPNGAIKSDKAFFTYLYDHYNVKGVIDMDGKLYSRQGTTFATRMILIDGRRSEEERAQSKVYPPTLEKSAGYKVENFGELYDLAERIKNNNKKTDGNEVLRTSTGIALPDNNDASGNANRSGRDGQSRQNESDGRRSESRGSNRGSQETASEGTPQRGRRGSVGVQQPRIPGLFDSQETSSAPQSQTGTSGERRSVGDNGRNGSADVQGSRTTNSGVGLNTPENPKETPKSNIEQAPAEPVKPKVEEKRELDTDKLSYRPHNTAYSLESVAPAAMVEAMDKMLTKIEKEHGNIDAFVTRELGYDSIEDMHNALAAEQVDSVAMAIYQMKHGQGMIIGDQTGVGKGRQMAALIRWACRQGKKPVFITQKADLFSDIYRDLVDIGSGELRPFIFNSDGAMVDNNGVVVHKPLSASAQAKVFAGHELPAGYDFAVLTYSQVNTGDQISQDEAKEAAKKSGERFQKKKKKDDKPKATPKASFLRALAKDNYMFLDESHTAAGKSNTGFYFQSILKTAKAVTFASATFAKRPDTMPMYALRTAMSKAKVKAEELIKIIENGGVTLQEIMSRALTQAGQMVRRERDMSDVKTDWKTVDDPETVKKARQNYDSTIEAFNAIIDFQKNWVSSYLDRLSHDLADVAASAGMRQGTEDLGISNVPFASKTYNYTKQLMLALKVDAIVDEVVKEIEAGRHPVIALENTMGSLLSEYAPGEVIEDTTFAASLLKGLRGVLRYTVKDEDGKEQQLELKPSQLGPEGEAAYHAVEDLIRQSTSGIFISPLDAITMKLQQKGYKVGELTGRNEMAVLDEKTGEYKVQRRTDKDKKKLARDFNSGALDVLILNKSASTGISLHASEKFSDQRQRTMIIAQPLADINDYMQMIGRIDRTGQVARGYYINLGLPVPAEGRFLMMLSTKLKSLNANTTTSQESESNDVEAPDLLNKYGSQVVVEYLRDNPDVYIKIGEPLKKDKARVSAAELDSYTPSEDDARKITGYVALLPTKEQDAFYNDVVRRYTELIKYLNDTGSNDLKISVLPLRARTIEKQISSEGADPTGDNPFAGHAYVEWVEMDVLKKPMKAAEVGKVIDQLNPEVDAPKVQAKTASQEKMLNQRMTPRVRQILDIVEKEYQAKMDKEDARYAEAKAKAEEAIKEQTEKINNSKRTPEQKKEAIEKYKSDRMQAVEETHNNMVNKIEASRERIEKPLRDFEVGDSYLVPDDLTTDTFFGASPAIFCGFKAKDDGITPSTSLAVFCTLDGRRKIEVKLSDWGALARIKNHTEQNWDAAHEVTLSNWDSQVSNETRKHGFIMTGNILQAFADAGQDGRVPGQLVTYTDIDGNVHDGILMGQHWEPSQLKGSTVPIKNRMDEIKNLPNGDHITSADGNVVIERLYSIYTISVPKSKKVGGQYYEDRRLLNLVRGQDFYPNRGQLRADIEPENIEEVVNVLSDLGVQMKSDTQVQFDTETEMGQAKASGRRFDEDVDNGIEVPADEYAKIAQQIATYPKKAERGHVFTDNNYYLCTDIDNEGNFKIVATLPIEGNEDLINEIRKGGRQDFIAIPVTESTSRIISEVKSRGGRISRDNANAKRFDSGSGGNASVSVGQQANTRGNRQETGRNSNAQTKESARRKSIARHIDNLLDKLGTKGRTVVHKSLNDVPADVREHIEQKHARGKKVRGWYDEADGKVHLFLPDIDSEYQAEKTIWHETVAHYGLRELIGKENLDKLLRQLWLTHKDGAMGEWVAERMQRNGWKLNEAIEEYLAREAEKNPFKEPGLWQRLRWMLAEVLHKMGFATDPTIADVQYLFWLSQNSISENNPMSVIKQQAFLHHLEREAANTPYVNMNAERVEDIYNPNAEGAYPDGKPRYSEETNEEVIERLEKEPKIKVYRAMQLIDGKLYPPMAAKQNGKLVEPIELGKWEKADEHPEMADGNGKFKLDKGNGKSLKAAYNPYIHTSTTMLNDQFSEAQNRDNLVVVECEVPESELTSGYKAEKAKDSVGKMDWKAGIIQGQLSGTREVILSRWDKPVRIVPTEEVAQHIADMIKDKVEVMPSNVVTPQQREALEKLGVKFVETNNRGFIKEGENAGKSYSSVYGKKKGRRFDEDIDNPMEYSAKKVYDNRLNSVETVFTEAYQDAMVSLKTAQNAIAKDKDIPDSQNAYMAENLMHGKNKNEQDLYNKMFRDPLINTINKIMNLTGMNWGDVDRYVYTKSGLERNREFFVRDWMEAELNKRIHSYEDLNDAEQDIYDRMANGIITKFEDGDIDEAERDKKLRQALQEAHIRYVRNVEYDWQMLKLEKYQDLKDGMITFPEYLEEVDRFIRYNIDGGFKAEDHDYSGFRAMFGDEDGKYSEAEIIDELMNTEGMIDDPAADADGTVEQLWEQINAATRYGLERYREAGMRSDEQIDRVEGMFHWYVPMRGFKEETGEDMYQYFTGKGREKSYLGGLLKHAKGRGSEANYPISTIFAMSYKAISDCNQNLVNQKLYRLCQANPNDLVIMSDSWAVFNEITGEWEEVAPEIPEDASEDEVREITLAWEDSMRQLALENKAKKIKGKAEFDYKPMDKKKQSEHIVDVRINGQPKKMIVTGNPRMAQALNGQLRFERGHNVFSKWNAAIKNFMASLFTSYSPTFALRNMFRDWTHFRMMLGVREGHGYAAQANKYYRQSLFKMVGLFKKYREGTLDESKGMERDFKDFMDNGGITGFVQMMKIDDIQKQMEKLYKQQKQGKTIRLNNKLWEYTLGAIEAVNEGIENNARFATYRASRHYAGRTKARSAYDAKEITVNFNRKGAGGKTAGFKSRDGVMPKKVIEDAAKAFGVSSQILGEGRIFFNATVQAIATTFKNFQNPDGSLNGKYIAKWAAKYAIPPFMFGLLLPAINKALANAFGGGDDDDPYANLAEWTRRRNICIYIGHDNFLTIPIGQELAAFLALGDIIAGNTYAPDLKPVDRDFGDEMVGVMNTFSPVDVSTKITKGGLMEDPISEVTGRTFSVLAPLVAVEQNLGWTGRPIYREDKFQNDQYTPEYQMVYQSTNPVLVNASKLLHELGGGDDITRGKLEVNPAIIQYLWEQYTGGPGKVFSNTISIGKDAKDILTGNESDFNIRKVEGLKAFVSQGDDRTQYYRTQAKYRKYSEDAKKLYHDVKGYENAATTDPTALMKLEKISQSEDFVRMQIVREADKQLSQINKAANKAEGKEKKELRRLYNEQVKAVVDMLDEVGKE